MRHLQGQCPTRDTDPPPVPSTIERPPHGTPHPPRSRRLYREDLPGRSWDDLAGQDTNGTSSILTTVDATPWMADGSVGFRITVSDANHTTNLTGDLFVVPAGCLADTLATPGEKIQAWDDTRIVSSDYYQYYLTDRISQIAEVIPV